VQCCTAALTKSEKNCATTYLSLRSVQPDCLLRPQKAVSRRTFFYFGAAPATAHENLRTVHCCRRHQFDIHHCCATMNIFIQLTVTRSCNSTQRTHCCVSTATMVTGNAPQSYVTRTLSCSLCQHVQTSSEAQTTSQPMGTRVNFRAGKAART